MKKVINLVLAMAVAGAAFAAETADQTVTYTVPAINDITVSGTPVLTLDELTSDATGTAFTPVTADATYSVFTNANGMKITVKLNEDMPKGVTLKLWMKAPGDADSADDISLTATPADLVTGISQVSEQDLAMTYTLSADATADAVTSDTRTVTFTIMSSL